MTKYAARISIAGLIALAVAVAGCGGGGSSSYGGSSSASTPAPKTASVKLASTNLGKVLVDSQGRTLYLFEADKGAMSACSGPCTSSWPPLTTSGKPAAGTGVQAAKLGTAKRADGTTGVTYNGHPLYTYAGDSAAGQTNGQGLDDFGAEWYVLSRAGNGID